MILRSIFGDRHFASINSICSLILILVCGFATDVAVGQSSTGQISGVITDSTGEMIPFADVTITNTATNVERKTTSNWAGAYVMTQLQPGPYSIKVNAAGFTVKVISVSALQVNQSLDQPVSLAVGALAQAVQVVANGELMQTSTSEVGAVIDPQEVHDIPLNGRNFTQLITLAPGVGPESTGQAASIGAGSLATVGIPGSSFSQPSVQGQWNRSNYYTLDGAINVASISSSYVVLPMIDSIEEFKVQSHSDNAEFGGVLGGVINVVTKPGSNSWRGGGFEYVRNGALDAKNPFTGLKDLTQNDFGGSVSGPVWIPKLYNGKDHTFFSFGYEGWRYSSNLDASHLTVPTAAELSGNFANSSLTCTNSSNQTVICPIYDPTTAPRTAFKGNIIPAGRIDALTQKFITTYFDTPNVPGATTNNDLVSAELKNNDDSYNIRADEQLGGNDTLFFRYTRMNYTVATPVTNKFTNSVLEHPENYAAGWTHIFRVSLIADAHFGYSQLSFTQGALPNAGVPSLQTAGLTQLLAPGYPSFSIPGYGGASAGSTDQANKNLSASANMTYVHLKHQMRAGFQYMRLGWQAADVPGTMSYIFAPQQTSDGISTSASGNALASALLSYPSQVSTTAQTYSLQYAVYAPYLQESWHATKKMTVNVGFRLDHFASPTLSNGGFLSEFDPNSGNWLLGASSLPQCVPAAAPCIPTGSGYMAATGTTGLGVSAANHIAYAPLSQVMPSADWNAGPRIGVAYEITPKLTVRGGFGVVADTLSGILQTIQANVGSWPDSSQSNTTYNPTSATTVPTTTVETATQNKGIALPGPTPFNSGNWMYDPKMKNAYSEQWNVEVQDQITGGSTLTLGYVGSHDARLPITGHYNVGTPGSHGADQPYPFLGNTEMAFSKGWSNYDAFEAKLQGRYFKSLNLLGSYTWQRTMDTGSGLFAVENGAGSNGPQYLNNLAGEYGPAAYNLKNILVITALYDLPFGPGKAHLTHGVGAYVLGDWQFNTTTSIHSGLPLSVTVDGDPAQICAGGSCLFGIGYERANAVGNPYPGSKNRSGWLNGSGFAMPTSGTFGTSGRGAYVGPGAVASDVSLFKLIPVREKVRAQIRFEAFNFINHTNLGQPLQDLSQPHTVDSNGVAQGFGTIHSSSSPREIQVGGRLEF